MQQTQQPHSKNFYQQYKHQHSHQNSNEQNKNQPFIDQKDNSLIYQLIQNKEEHQNKINTLQVQNKHKIPSQVYQANQHQQYGQLLEVSQLLLPKQKLEYPEINREEIYKNYKHIQEDNRIKVFIDPNPTNNHQMNSRGKHGNEPITQISQPQLIIDKKQPTTIQRVNNDKKQTIQRINFNKKQKRIFNDLRIRDIHRGEYDSKQHPKTKRKQPINAKKPHQSKPSSQSNLSESQTNVFEEFLQFKQKKKSKSVNFLIKKVQSLQKHIRQLKGQADHKDRNKFTKNSKTSEKSQVKPIRLSSNLINIKIETQNLHIKEDIMSELQRLKQKVDILQNKSKDFNSSKKIISNKYDQYQSMSPDNMAQSKIQTNSKLIYSQIREGNMKVSGKIFKKSEVNQQQSQINSSPNAQEYYKQQFVPKIKQFNILNLQKIQNSHEKQQEVNKNIKQLKKEEIKQIKQIKKHDKQEAFSHLQARDAITIAKNKNKKEILLGHQKNQNQQELHQDINDISEVKKRQSVKIIDSEIMNEQYPKGIKNYQSESYKNEQEISQQRAFIRSGNIAKRPPANYVAPKENVSRQQWQQSLKMLQFDLGKQIFVVDTQQNRKFSNQWYKQINSFHEAQQTIPKIPQIIKFPTYDSTEEELIAMGKQLFNLFGIMKVNDDKTVLTVKKYKNCTYFGIDVQNNILLHYEGKIYFGGWKQFMNGQGQKSGEGIQYQKNKFIFKGTYKEGKKSGLGVYKVYNSNLKASIYIGQFNEGLKHGEGKQFDQNGVCYVGQWKDGKKDGFGKLQLGKTEYYQGIFQKGLKTGHGSQFFQNGDKYVGDYHLGKFHGKGKYEWINGSTYEGLFKNGMRNGKGLWKSSPKIGDQYEGEYENDLKHGFGIYRWANGSSYEGNFFKDQKHGKGVITHQNGKSSALQWNNGEVVGRVEGNSQQQMPFTLSNGHIRNYNKQLPFNKNFLSKQKNKDNPLTNMNFLNKMKPSHSTSSHNNLANINPTDGEFKKHRNTLMHPEFNQRPMTSKSSNSHSNFKLERKSNNNNGFPKDPPYRGIQMTTNIKKF